jgi:hypothetical protein
MQTTKNSWLLQFLPIKLWCKFYAYSCGMKITLWKSQTFHSPLFLADQDILRILWNTKLHCHRFKPFVKAAIFA